MRKAAVICVIVVAVGQSLHALLSVPYAYTALALSAWVFFGHLITADDDAPGGWSNPDGSATFPWVSLAAKGGVFLGLCLLVALVPAVRGW